MRWKGEWFLFQGPFETLQDENSSVFSVGCRDFFGHSKAYYQAQTPLVLDTSTWKSHFKSEGLSRSFDWQGPSRELYSKSFALTQQEIKQGNWKKAVPMSLDRANGTISDTEKRALLSRLSDAHESLIPYGFWKDGQGMIGLTPEILFFREGQSLSTMALAGTEKKQGPCHLLQDDKNLKEHAFVVQELIEKLSRFGQVAFEGPQILELPTLYHLITRFSLKIEKNWEDRQALETFHPTSALGISPFDRWTELEKLPEQKDRQFFGSPLMFKLSSEKTLALVALRQIQWNQVEIKIGAGGGVVKESQEELEWNEILAKMESVKKLMGIS